MFDFIETMSGKVPEEIIDMFVNASEFHNVDPWAALQSCMIEYAKKNNSAQFDYSAMSAKERFLFEQVIEFQDFFEIVKNQKELETTVYEGANTVAVCLAITESAQTGHPIQPKYF